MSFIAQIGSERTTMQRIRGTARKEIIPNRLLGVGLRGSASGISLLRSEDGKGHLVGNTRPEVYARRRNARNSARRSMQVFGVESVLPIGSRIDVRGETACVEHALAWVP